MNHLAHVFLSGKEADMTRGNLIADFVTGRDARQCAPRFKRGIQLHYAIDIFTDTHPIVKLSTKHLHTYHHKYAPVVVDVFYDYFLARNWQIYAPQMDVETDMRSFINDTYKILQEDTSDLPENFSKLLPNMIKNDWLFQGTQLEGQKKIFTMLGKRAKFENDFENAVQHLIKFHDEIEHEFNLFFPDLIKHVQTILQKK